MINVSNEFKELMQTRTDFKEYAEITFTDGTKMTLDESQFTTANNSVTDGAALSAVPIGVAIQKIVQLEILNDQEQWESYDFYGARIHLYLTFELSSTTEKVERGYYTVTTPETYGDTIIVTAYDDMYKADQSYDSELKYPATIKDMLVEICENCAIPLLSTTFTHGDFTVSAKPDIQYTYRQVISYIAMLAGGNARINNAGYLEVLTYADIIGNQYYNNLDQVNEDDPDCALSSWQSLTTDKNDVKVTGVALTVTDSSGQRKILTGEEGYVLSVTNPLINADDRTSLVTGMADISESLIGLTFRKFSGTSIANPLIEFMDFVAVKDRRGRLYQSFITDVTFVFLGSTTVKNSAESAISANATYAGNINTEVQLRRLVSDEKTAREQAVDTLSTALANSSGMYETEETQQDGSIIRYFHDKPTLSESKSVIKFTADAIGVSSDGGKTYPYGFTVTGEMVTRLLAAEGINADWIKTGALTVKDSSGSAVFSADMDSGTVTMSSALISVDGKSLDSKFSESKSYTDTQVVEVKTYTDEKTTEANTYTDEQIKDVKTYTHEEITDANDYADKLAEEAKAYTDGQVDEANTYTDTQIATAKETIQQTYATQSSLTQTAAAIRSEVSEEVTTVKTYTDNQIAASEQTAANTYATKSSVSQTASEIRSEVSAAQTSANNYTDSKVSSANSYTDTQVSGAKSYADTQIAASEKTAANTYATKSSVSQTASEIRSEVSAAQTSANNYTDSKVSSANSYTDTQVSGAKSYADTQIAASEKTAANTYATQSAVSQRFNNITLQLVNSGGTVVSQIKMQDDIIKLTGDVIADTLTVAKLFAKDITTTGNFQINNSGCGVRLEDGTFKIGNGIWNTLAKWGYISFNSNTVSISTIGAGGHVNITGSTGVSITGTTTINGLQTTWLPQASSWTPTVAGASSYSIQKGYYIKFSTTYALVGFEVYGSFGGSTTSRISITGCPVSSTNGHASGGGHLSGYYSASNVVFTGWNMNKAGTIYAVGQQTGTTGATWGSTAIYQKSSGDFSAAGTLFVQIS